MHKKPVNQNIQRTRRTETGRNAFVRLHQGNFNKVATLKK